MGLYKWYKRIRDKNNLNKFELFQKEPELKYENEQKERGTNKKK